MSATLLAGLAQATGTTRYYRRAPHLVYTVGVRYLAEKASCYWLLDIVWSLRWAPRTSTALRTRDHLICSLQVDVEQKQGTFTATAWGSDTPLYMQAIPYTDFPLEHISLYFKYDPYLGEHVALLPSED